MLEFVVRPIVIDVDDAGEVVARVPEEMTPAWTFVGRHAIETELAGRLDELDGLLEQRTAALNAKPNRAQRRRRRPK